MHKAVPMGNRLVNASHFDAKKLAPRTLITVRKMATPPSLGTGLLCRCRLNCGGATHPRAIAKLRIDLVNTKERKPDNCTAQTLSPFTGKEEGKRASSLVQALKDLILFRAVRIESAKV